MLVMKGGRLLFLYYQVFTMIVVPMSFKKKKLNCEISPSFPLRLKLAQINWNSATNKEDEFSHQMWNIYFLCQKKTKDKRHAELKMQLRTNSD